MNTDPTIQALAEDAGADIKLAQQVVDAIKKAKSGDKSDLITLIPAVAAHVKQDVADVKAALPVIKAGYKTTEFWLTVGGVVAVVVSNALGHPLPFNVDAVLAALIAVYAAVRGFTKGTA